MRISYQEDFAGVEDDGVDARHLLEEHEPDGDEQGLEVGAAEELAAPRRVACVLLGFVGHALDLAHLV